MSKAKQVARSALIIMILTLGSKFLGFFRVTLIGDKFGASMETDTFMLAMTATTMVTSFITGSIGTTFIPILSEIDEKEGKEGRIAHTNNMINIIFAISALLVVLMYIASPAIVTLISKGEFTGAQFDLGVKLIRLGVPMILFAGIIGVFTGFLQYQERFTSTSLIGIPFNLIYIIFLMFFSSKFGIKGLMVSAVIAVASQFLILIPESVKLGYKHSFKFDVKDEYVKKIVYLSLPVLIGVAINDINALVDKTLASGLVTGSISALDFANKLNGLILGLFITTITTIIFPLLAKESNNDNVKGMKRIMGYGINLILLITVPAMVGLIVLRTPIVQVAFERGKFDAAATALTSPALMFYAIGLISMSLRLLLNRVFYSLQDTRTPMVNGAISVVFNVAFSLTLVRFMGHAGLALATSIASTVATLLMFYSLKKKIGNLGTRDYLLTFTKTGISAGAMGLVAYLVYNGLYGILGLSKLYNAISLFAAAGLGALVYGILCYALKVKEVRDLVDNLKERFKR